MRGVLLSGWRRHCKRYCTLPLLALAAAWFVPMAFGQSESCGANAVETGRIEDADSVRVICKCIQGFRLEGGECVRAQQAATTEPASGDRTASEAEFCTRRKSARDRLAAGLPVQLDAIHRTEAQLDAAERGVAAARAEAQLVLIGGAVTQARAYAQKVLTSTDALRGEIEVLSGIDRAHRDMLIRLLNTMTFGADKLYRSEKAGYEAATEAQVQVRDMSQLSVEVYKLLVESGIAEQAGVQLSEDVLGPYGGFAFRGTEILIDLGVAVRNGSISKADREMAQKNLDTMRDQYQRITERIAEIDGEIGKRCHSERLDSK
jgi:hypothetical protein